MLKLINYSYNRHPSTIVASEDQSTTGGKILLINTRSYYSALMEREEEEKDEEHLRQAATHPAVPPDTTIAPKSVHAASVNTDHCAPNDTACLSEVERRRSFFVEMLQKNDDLHKEGVPPYDVAQVPKLTLSADQGVEEWIVLAELIEKHYFDYDGFVVQNGSDGMVFTATALSFMLENLGKPVIFTGSLIPATRIYTDMKRNTILSLMLAACRQLSEVCILFDDKLYRANRTIKVSRASLRPYDSPHFPPLARMSGSLKLWGPLLRPQPHGRLQVMRHMHTKILCLQIGPYVPIEVLVSCIQHSTARALIVACYGSGNAPSRDGFMKQIMDKAAEKKMLVVVTSQNQYGKVNLSTYELGRKMLQAGAISAAEMTPQTTYVKLKYLFGLGLSNAEVRAAMESDLRGELFIANSKL